MTSITTDTARSDFEAALATLEAVEAVQAHPHKVIDAAMFEIVDQTHAILSWPADTLEAVKLKAWALAWKW